MSTTKQLRIGPEITFRGQEVFLQGIKIGEFEKPWEAIKAIERGLRKWTDSITEAK